MQHARNTIGAPHHERESIRPSWPANTERPTAQPHWSYDENLRTRAARKRRHGPYSAVAAAGLAKLLDSIR